MGVAVRLIVAVTATAVALAAPAARPATAADLGSEIAAAVNAYRAEHGRAQLTPYPAAEAIGQAHDHFVATGDMHARFTESSDFYLARGGAGFGEVQAWVTETCSAGKLVQQWIDSDFHRGILLTGDATHFLAVGSCTDEDARGTAHVITHPAATDSPAEQPTTSEPQTEPAPATEPSPAETPEELAPEPSASTPSGLDAEPDEPVEEVAAPHEPTDAGPAELARQTSAVARRGDFGSARPPETDVAASTSGSQEHVRANRAAVTWTIDASSRDEREEPTVRASEAIVLAMAERVALRPQGLPITAAACSGLVGLAVLLRRKRAGRPK